MYQTDVLEILGLLTRLGVRDERMDEALALVAAKQDAQGRWKLASTFNGRFVADIEAKGRAEPLDHAAGVAGAHGGGAGHDRLRDRPGSSHRPPAGTPLRRTRVRIRPRAMLPCGHFGRRGVRPCSTSSTPSNSPP